MRNEPTFSETSEVIIVIIVDRVFIVQTGQTGRTGRTGRRGRTGRTGRTYILMNSQPARVPKQVSQFFFQLKQWTLEHGVSAQQLD